MKPEEELKQKLKQVNSVLSEGVMPTTTVLIGTEEMPFGCDQHLEELVRTLDGLERLKNCYPKGSATRQTYSMACTRLKKLVKFLSLRERIEVQTQS